jgi:hypothetical protein
MIVHPAGDRAGAASPGGAIGDPGYGA